MSRLTQAQKRNLVEMVNPKTGLSLFWTPRGSAEMACIDALVRKGLLRGSYMNRAGSSIELTDEGLRVAKDLAPAAVVPGAPADGNT